MAEKIELISFGVELIPEIALGKLAEAEQQIKSDFKTVTVPITPTADKKATQAAVKEIQKYVKSTTGDGAIKLAFDSKELRDAKKSLDGIKKEREEIQKIRNYTSDSEKKKDTRDAIISRGQQEVKALRSPEHSRNESDNFYDRAKEIYAERNKNTKNKLSEEEFIDQAFGALTAKNRIQHNIKKINKITSTEGWDESKEQIKEVGQLKNEIELRKNYLKEITSHNTVGSAGFEKLLGEWDINPNDSSLNISDDLSKIIDTKLNSFISDYDQQILAAETFVKGKLGEYMKNWDSLFEQEGIHPKEPSEETLKALKEESEPITHQKYTGAKNGANNLVERASKGEKLTDEDIQRAKEFKAILDKGTPTGNTVQVSKEVYDSLSRLIDPNMALEYKAPSNVSGLKDRALNFAYGKAKSFTQQFNQKAAGQNDISESEVQSLIQALDVVDEFNSRRDKTTDDFDYITKAREWFKSNKDNYGIVAKNPSVPEPPQAVKNTGVHEIVDKDSKIDNDSIREPSVKVTADTSQLESALAKVNEKIAALDNKEVNIILKANDDDLKLAEEKINTLQDSIKNKNVEGTAADTFNIDGILAKINELKDKGIIIDIKADTNDFDAGVSRVQSIFDDNGKDIVIDFKADTTDFDAGVTRIQNVQSQDGKGIRVDFKGETSEIEKAETSVQKLRSEDGKNVQIKIDIDNSELTSAKEEIEKLRASASEPIKVSINTDAVLDDLVAVEKIINDLKKNLDLKVKFNTGQSFTDKKASDIETMTNKIANLADKSTAYSAKIAGAFAGIGSSIREVTRLVDNLNKKFNLTGEIATGLKNMNKVLAGGNVGGANDGTALRNTNPKSDRVKNAADRALSKTIVSQDLEQYTTEFATKVEATVNRIRDLKEKHSGDVFFDNKEIEEDIRELHRLNAELTEHGRLRNQFKLQNNQGTVIGEGLSLNDFNEAKAEELFRASGVNSNILETSMGRNGMAAYIKARSRDDGKLEKYAINFNQDTGIARSQLKSRSEYKSLFGQIVGDMGQEVTKLSKYLISMGGIDVVWQGFQQGIESIKEMDAAMTELKKVTSDTSDVYATVEKDMYATGKDIGRDAVELTKSTADWARLGYNTQDSEKMSKWTGILMNVSEFEQVDDATNALISIMQGFDKGADDVENVVDVLNNIGNKEPISSDEIASSLQRSASALKAGGNTYEQAVALTTVGKYSCLGCAEMYNQRTHLIALVA